MRWKTMLAGVSLATLTQTALAQAQETANNPATTTTPAQQAATAPSNPQDNATAGADDANATAEIIVTARRSSESLQDVPQSVTVVSGEAVQKLNFTSFSDVSAAVSGLTLNKGPVTAGSNPAPSIRGVSYEATSSPSPTVDIYVNETTVQSNIAFNAIYDVGGFQVLRGPQGTLRGRTAPSGAILMSTRRADTDRWGGYVSMLATDKNQINAQAALNIPVVEGLVGLRVAGLVEGSDADFIRSANTGRSPFRNTSSGRASLLFTPATNLTASLVYQYLKRDERRYDAVEGNGAPGGLVATAPAGYNGPVIRASDRLGANDAMRDFAQRTHLVTANVTWDVLGHSLNYTGGYISDLGVTAGDIDAGNAVLAPTNGALSSNLRSKAIQWTHEIRLSSAGSGHLVDYSVGYFHSRNGGAGVTGTQPAAALNGTFGPPGSPDPRIFNPKFLLNALIQSSGTVEENSFYGNLTLHLGDKTELTGGGRYIINKADTTTKVFVSSGFIAVRLPFPCAVAGFGSTYAGSCDIPIAANPVPVTNAVQRNTARPAVYNASLRHRFSDQVLAYATVGSSWRRGGSNTGITNADNNPLLAALNYTPNETSTSYEVGVKTNWLDQRLRLNLAGFYQKYKNLIFQVTSIPYLQSNGQTAQVANTNINVGADAVVTGFDLDGAFQATGNFSVSLGVSYADGKVDNDTVPCRDANFDGVEDSGSPTVAQFRTAGTYVAQCRSNQSVSRDPIWSGNLQSEVHVPVSDAGDGYVRGLLNYYPGNSRASVGYKVPGYALLNLYAGIRSPDGGWDIGIFARNVTNTGVTLSRDPSLIATTSNIDSFFGGTGYRYVTYTAPRQIGLNVRFAFGAR